jgi:uncharacterized protein (UPF0261 family)
VSCRFDDCPGFASADPAAKNIIAHTSAIIVNGNIRASIRFIESSGNFDLSRARSYQQMPCQFRSRVYVANVAQACDRITLAMPHVVRWNIR